MPRSRASEVLPSSDRGSTSPVGVTNGRQDNTFNLEGPRPPLAKGRGAAGREGPETDRLLEGDPLKHGEENVVSARFELHAEKGGEACVVVQHRTAAGKMRQKDRPGRRRVAQRSEETVEGHGVGCAFAGRHR